MKRILLLLLLPILAAGILASAAGAEDVPPAGEEEIAEWTVMFYFCGSDLESKYGYASGNLEEISQVVYPDSMIPTYKYMLAGEEDIDWGKLDRGTKVNVLIETGGSRKWHTGENFPDMDVSADSLQRWGFYRNSFWRGKHEEDYSEDHSGDYLEGFVLLETLPLASMAEPDTLTDFIRWGAQTYPAKKYALVLWDHGSGALSGLFIDELFGGDVMYLYELKQALDNSGVQLETLVIDACLMANLETAWAVKDSARWLVASEETVPGKGTAVKEWLQELFNYPECDGRILGRNICDMTQIKYDDEEDEEIQRMLTWSVIDLDQIEKLAGPMERFFTELGDDLKNYPELLVQAAGLFQKAEEYGDGRQYMRDIASVFYNSNASFVISIDIRNDILQALSEAVVYSVHGAGRSSARGLSFCYPVNADSTAMDLYAKNCPSRRYLAFLDAISDWTAPDVVYETTERLPEVSGIEALKITGRKVFTPDGLPAIQSDTYNGGGDNLFYRLYYLDPNTEQPVCLGRTNCRLSYNVDDQHFLMYANEPCIWPCIDGVPCTMDILIEKYVGGATVVLYGIPVQMGSETRYLRCARIDPFDNTEKRTYEVFGIWGTYDQNSQMADRSTIKLTEAFGQEYRLLWPIGEPGWRTAPHYTPAGRSMRIVRALDVEEKPLPPGTYYLEYEVTDVFMRSYLMERIEMHWDGQKITLPEGFTWEGEIQPQRIGSQAAP